MKQINLKGTVLNRYSVCYIYMFFIFSMYACGKSANEQESIEFITDPNTQSVTFNNLMDITDNTILENDRNDSLAFLILPVQASCPSCRNKTIDSIVKRKDDLQRKHYIIISANVGRKTINGYFRENDKELPVINNKLFLDSTNKAYKHDLYDKKPTIYYTYNQKVYKKVAAIPATVREDLREFFTGHRGNKQLAKN
jgi:hypothetical protein